MFLHQIELLFRRFETTCVSYVCQQVCLHHPTSMPMTLWTPWRKRQQLAPSRNWYAHKTITCIYENVQKLLNFVKFSVKNSCSGMEFLPTFDNLECLRSVLKWRRNPRQFWWTEGDVFDFGQKIAILKWISWETFTGTWNGALESWTRSPLLYNSLLPKWNASSSIHQWGSDTTWTSLNSIDCQKWDEIPPKTSWVFERL